MAQTLQALSPGDSGVAEAFSTGPAGLLLGTGPNGAPMTMRLFRGEPTRLFLAAPDYVKWLLAFRAMCLGAHLSVLAEDHRQWLSLADTVRACGGTIDVLRTPDNVPGQGRPYRPSLVIDEMDALGGNARVGAWQALVVVGNPQSSKAISELRACELALVAPLEGKGAEHLRRAYALTAAQMKAVGELGESDVAVASVRRVARVKMPPGAIEYRMLFGG